MADQGQGHTIKDKIKHLFHQDKKAQVTTPDGSPGDANVISRPSNTTTNVPEAFYVGAAPVVPQETHSTAPYSSALGQHQIPQRDLPTSVPADSSAMLGAPPSNTKPKNELSTEGADNRETDPRGETPFTETDGTAETYPGTYLSGETPETNPSETPVTESDDTAETHPSGEPRITEFDGTAETYRSGETPGTESGVKIEDYLDKESTPQTEDYPVTDSVVENKKITPIESLKGIFAGEKTVNQDDQKIAQENA